MTCREYPNKGARLVNNKFVVKLSGEERKRLSRLISKAKPRQRPSATHAFCSRRRGADEEICRAGPNQEDGHELRHVGLRAHRLSTLRLTSQRSRVEIEPRCLQASSRCIYPRAVVARGLTNRPDRARDAVHQCSHRFSCRLAPPGTAHALNNTSTRAPLLASGERCRLGTATESWELSGHS